MEEIVNLLTEEQKDHIVEWVAHYLNGDYTEIVLTWRGYGHDQPTVMSAQWVPQALVEMAKVIQKQRKEKNG